MSLNHFKNKFTSPLNSIVAGYIHTCFIGIFFYFNDFYKESNFFTYGVPVEFMGKTIDNEEIYYLILVLIFVHQIINNFINQITYPWIINCIQDPKCNDIIYNKRTSLIIINMFALYSELDMILIIFSVMSQITFFLTIICANMISITLINLQYIKQKKSRQESTYYDPLTICTNV